MEWNWLSGNSTTPFLLSESTGDSEEVNLDVHHDHEEDGGAMDEQEGVSFRFNDEDHEVVVEDDEDDAQSCSYDHSSYINNTRYGGSKYDQSQRLIYDGDDDDDGDIDDDDGDIDDDEDDDDKKSQYQTKVMDSSKQQWRSQKSCVHDPSNQREIDRKFWETCLAS